MTDLQNFMQANEPSNGSKGILAPFMEDIQTLVENGYNVKDIQKFVNDVKGVEVSYQVTRYTVKKIEAEIEKADHD